MSFNSYRLSVVNYLSYKFQSIDGKNHLNSILKRNVMQHGPALKSHQLETMKAWYIQPYLQIVADAVEDKGTAVLKNLVEIATNPITLKQKNLVVGEGVAQPDEELKTAIVKVLGRLPIDDFNSLYDALYILLHQCRLNKSPDSPYADDHNTAMAQQYINNPDKLYENTVPKKGKVSFKLREKEVEPSSEQIEAGFLIAVKDVLGEIVAERKEEQESKKRKRVSKDESDSGSDSEDTIDLTLESSSSYLPQFKQSQKQIELDLQLALEMEKEEKKHSAKRPRLSPDEILARRLQEEEDSAYAQYLNSSNRM
jgi:hypothetical protein